MSIASEITRLQGAKADIKTAIEAKGVTVPSATKLDDYDTYIGQIETKVPVNQAIQKLSKRTVTDPVSGDVTEQWYRSETVIGNVTTTPSETCRDDTELVEALIPDTITNLGTYTFAGCSSIERVNLQNVTVIGGYSFQDCTSLKSIKIGKYTTTFGSYCFSGCSNLAEMTFEDKNSVTTIGQRAFQNTKISFDVDFPSLAGDLGGTGVRPFYNTLVRRVVNLGVITRIRDESFRACSKLESVIIPATLTNLSYMAFYNCPELRTVTYLGTTSSTLGNSVFGQSYKARVIVPYSADHSVLTTFRTASDNWKSFAARVFEADPTFVPLPSGYTELEYITCTAEQYIDTGLVGNQTVTVDLSFYSDYTNTTMHIFGRSTGDTSTSVIMSIANSSGMSRLGGAYKSTGWGTRPDYDASLRSNGILKNNTFSAWNGTVGEFTTGDNMLLGWSGNNASNYFKGDIKYCRVWMAGVLTRDFIPCTNDSSVAGMWDRVNGVFYASASGVDFIAGSPVTV